MKVKVAKWGNSLGVRLPKAAAESVGVRDGSELDLTIAGGELRLRKPYKTSAERLAEMLAEIDRLGLEPSETVDWGPDRGSEIIDDAYSRGEIALDDILARTPAKPRTVKREPRKIRVRARRP
jgi:antitoxin MazE